jgi:gas vesicle protein
MKRSELAEYIKETIVDVLTEVSQDDVDTLKAYNDELEKTKELSTDLTEDEDAEPTAKDIKKNDSISTISRKLQDTSKEMKAVVNKWKKAEGEDKERLLARLKELTKIKKELEGLL